jgi:hypothetical protein
MRIPLIASLALASVAAAGCGGGGGSNNSAGSSSSSESPTAAAFHYAHCMRQHGVANFPEPKISTSNGSTKIAIAVPGGKRALLNSPQLRAAQQACEAILPGPQQFTPAQQRVREQAFLAFARCIRAHGVSSFPDPTPQGEISREMLAAAHINIAAPNVQTAAYSCVSTTHGMITAAQVHQAIQHLVNGGD